MICDVCFSIFEAAGRNWGYHHSDVYGFAKSVASAATEECAICWRLARNLVGGAEALREFRSILKLLETWFEPVKPYADRFPTIPVYQWTLRKAVKVDETEDYFVLTFRPVPISSDVIDRYKKRDGIPDAVFYLLNQPGPSTEFSTQSFNQNTAESWDQIERWLSKCTSLNHPRCWANGDTFAPMRLLDVRLDSTSELHKGCRLPVVITSENFNERYVALSHCWGPGPHLFPQLLAENMEAYTREGVLWEDISRNRNFAEAIIVTRKLQIGYIWIDSLCIVQNSEEDWNQQAPLMHQIYRYAHCTVAATDSEQPDGGLFRSRSGLFTGYTSTTVTLRGERWYLFPGDLWERDLLQSPLYDRGWAFQERMLSPRVLHFAEHQIFWDCATISSCEVFPDGLPRQLDSVAAIDRNWRARLQTQQLQGSPLDLANSSKLFWRNAVRRYTACSLAQPQKDKLQAIWGVAKLVRDVERDTYACGLWSSNLAEQLAWTIIDNSQAKQNPGVAPSWSWASIHDAIIEIPSRWRSETQFYTVKAHDINKEIAFTLKNESDPSADPEKSTFLGSANDREPQLATRSIPMQGLISSKPVTLKKHEGSNMWELWVHGQAEKLSGIEIVIDSVDFLCRNISEFGRDSITCDFILLSASVEEMGAKNEYGLPEYRPVGAVLKKTYSGTALLIDRLGYLSDVYRRIGVLKFKKLPSTTWLQICRASGQETGSTARLDTKKYRKIFLQ